MKTAPARAGPQTGRAPDPKRRASLALERLATQERALVLKLLLDRHAELREEAERLAVELLSSPSAEEITQDVCEALTSLGMDALNGRAGRHSWGYVEPTEAAWELLHEAMEGFLADMRRRMELGLTESAETICRGIVAGLRSAADQDSDGPLGWAPDFPLEEACRAVGELLQACPKVRREEINERLLARIEAEAPDWSGALECATKPAIRGK